MNDNKELDPSYIKELYTIPLSNMDVNQMNYYLTLFNNFVNNINKNKEYFYLIGSSNKLLDSSILESRNYCNSGKSIN